MNDVAKENKTKVEKILEWAIMMFDDIAKEISGKAEDYHGLTYHLTGHQMEQIGLDAAHYSSYESKYNRYFMVPICDSELTATRGLS